MLNTSGPSSAPYFCQKKATENYFRVCQLIMTICSDLFRDILSRHIKPSDLRLELDNNRGKLERIMNTQQKEQIYPASGCTALSAKDLDISVLYIILRNICNIPKHKAGWGNTPLTGDMRLSACIERIRIERNLVSGHSIIGAMNDTEFKKHWEELKDAIIHIEKQMIGGDMYERGVNDLFSCDLNPTRSKWYAAEFRKIQENMHTKQEKIENLESSTNTTKRKFQKSQDDFKKHKDEMQEKVERLERTLLATNRSLKKFKKKSKDDLQKHREEMQEVMKKLLSNEKEKKDPILLVTILPSILQTSHISVPGIENICKISLASPDKLWVSDGEEELLQVDFKGHLRQRSVIQYSISHTITGNGNLLFTCGENVKKFKSDGTITTLITSTENVECIHSSRINGDILVGIYCTIPHTETSIGKVIRYDKKGKKLLDIEQDNNGQQLFQVPYDITENKNGDIWTSDKCMAVVVDKSGDHRFNYTGLPSQSSFRPQRICTDVLGYVLVCDNFSSSIHLLSKEGRLLSILLPKQYNMRPPFALCVDDKHNLYLGEYESNIITVFKYLEVTEQ